MQEKCRIQSPVCKDCPGKRRVSDLNDLICTCKDHFMLCTIINLFQIFSYAFRYSVCQHICGSAWSIQFMFVVLFYNIRIEACFI